MQRSAELNIIEIWLRIGVEWGIQLNFCSSALKNLYEGAWKLKKVQIMNDSE